MAINSTLSDRTSGSALFADISGFTALTESLREKYGSRQGAEELSKQLGKVYSALISEIEKYGGSVIGFAGDSMLCWFDASIDLTGFSNLSGLTVSAAFGMQEAIKQFPELALKVCIASGAARRFVVGDETIQRIDTLAGATVTRTATGEHLSTRGEVLVDEVRANTLSEAIKIVEWREDQESKERFAVVSAFTGTSQPITSETVITNNDTLKPFVHPAVYERESIVRPDHERRRTDPARC